MTAHILRNPKIFESYRKSFEKAAEDFCSRSNMVIPHTKDSFMEILERSVYDPDYALIVVLDDILRLVGVAVLVKVEMFTGGEDGAEVALAYTRPDRAGLKTTPLIVQKVREQASEWGVNKVGMVSTRNKNKAWGRLGFHPAGTVYVLEL